MKYCLLLQVTTECEHPTGLPVKLQQSPARLEMPPFDPALGSSE